MNRNRDFYSDIAMKGIPNYDILVTNPPYSGEHKPKLLDYLLTSHSHSDRPGSGSGSGTDKKRYSIILTLLVNL